LRLAPLSFPGRTPLAMRGVTVAQLRTFARSYPGADSRSMQRRMLEGVPGVRGGVGCLDGLSYSEWQVGARPQLPCAIISYSWELPWEILISYLAKNIGYARTRIQRRAFPSV
jgi:hypothetical protein